jgi:hypothetical protein
VGLENGELEHIATRGIWSHSGFGITGWRGVDSQLRLPGFSLVDVEGRLHSLGAVDLSAEMCAEFALSAELIVVCEHVDSWSCV